MNTCWNTLGILLNLFGTLLSLKNILIMTNEDISKIGTAEEYDRDKTDDYKKNRRNTRIGMIMIVIGSLIQIIILWT